MTWSNTEHKLRSKVVEKTISCQASVMPPNWQQGKKKKLRLAQAQAKKLVKKLRLRLLP